MVKICPFLPQHVSPAIKLWEQTQHIGLNAVDDQPEALVRFLQRNDGFSFVAQSGSTLVGACLCGHDLRRAAIYHLAVSTEYRGQGIGQKLLHASLSALEAIGITKCHAFVFRDNPHAERFWKPQGWLLRDELYMFSKSL